MTTKQTLICDRCTKETDNDNTDGWSFLSDRIHHTTLDLCQQCYKSFRVWMKKR